ncbi:hypothetical protein [Nocardia sp. NBC_01377]|uniref:hypothetical protein n=1 Tax=Nocardia sp. NBC_01377 TaxID=2903595 RepID=UPI0038638AE1
MTGSPISYAVLSSGIPDDPNLGAAPEDSPEVPVMYTARSLAALEVAGLAAQVSDAARALAPRALDSEAHGALLADAIAVRALADRFVAAAAVAERGNEATWRELGDAAGMSGSTAHSTWKSAEADWETAYLDVLSAAVLGDPDLDATRRAARLDTWIGAHGGDESAPGPVAARLELLSTDGEAEQLARLDTRLLEQDTEPDPELYAALVLRRAEVDEALAAALAPRLRREQLRRAAANRAYARELVAELPAAVAARYRERLDTPKIAEYASSDVPAPVPIPTVVASIGPTESATAESDSAPPL